MTNYRLTDMGLVAWTAALILWYPASAVPPAQSHKDCVAQAGGVTTRLKASDNAEVGRRDALRSQLFQNVLATVDPERQEGLRTAECA